MSKNDSIALPHKKKIIGLLGLAFGSTNKGCEALGYGFLNVLQTIAENDNTGFDVHIFEKCDIQKILLNGNYDCLDLQSIPIPGVGTVPHIKEHIRNFRKCDIIFDFTAGDSFSDIYGMKRFVLRSTIKILAEQSGNPFVLGSQTYGPYKSTVAKMVARRIIKKATAVYARDQMSCDRVKALTKREADLTVDVAFAMQYTPTVIESNKVKVGFNPSGLLWNGGYTLSNQFGLTVDYQKYCRKVISAMLSSGGYEIYLVPHVISNNYSEIDNDSVACRELKIEFPALIEAPAFDTPVEVKSYISGMDVFTGARMHATIAAFTTGVPVIPFSYSPKFEGLFTSLGYDHVISATKVTTEDAINDTLKMVRDKDDLKAELIMLKPVIGRGVDYLVEETKKLLS